MSIKSLLIVAFICLSCGGSIVRAQESQVATTSQKGLCSTIVIPFTSSTQNNEDGSSEQWISFRQEVYIKYNNAMRFLYLMYKDKIQSVENIESACFKENLLNFFNQVESKFPNLLSDSSFKLVFDNLKKTSQRQDLRILYLTEQRKNEFVKKNRFLKVDKDLLYGYFDKMNNTIYIDFYGFESERELMSYIFHELNHPSDPFTDHVGDIITSITHEMKLPPDFIISDFQEHNIQLFLQQEFISDKNFEIWLSLLANNSDSSLWFNEDMNRIYFNYLNETEGTNFTFKYDEYKNVIARIAIIFLQQAKTYIEEVRVVQVTTVFTGYLYDIIDKNELPSAKLLRNNKSILEEVRKRYFTGDQEMASKDPDCITRINSIVYEKINTYFNQINDKIGFDFILVSRSNNFFSL